MNTNSLPELNCFLKKFERQLSNVDVHVQSVKHTLRFNTFFTPGSIKTLRLYTLSNFYNHNNTFSSGKARVHNKILIKQSYLILAWIDYISKNQNLPTSNHSLSYGNNSTISSKKPYLSKNKISVPSLFIHPTKDYKTTVIKSPMAHKTFSQEQFMIRYYTLSLSFLTSLGVNHQRYQRQPGEFNKNIYYILSLISIIPEVSTNMLSLSRYSLLISMPLLTSYFSYYKL